MLRAFKIHKKRETTTDERERERERGRDNCPNVFNVTRSDAFISLLGGSRGRKLTISPEVLEARMH